MNENQAGNSSDAKPYLRIDRLTKKFGTFATLDRVSLEVFEGELVCFL